jgi:hypothetical protein
MLAGPAAQDESLIAQEIAGSSPASSTKARLLEPCETKSVAKGSSHATRLIVFSSTMSRSSHR